MKIAHTSSESRKKTNRVLAQARASKPTQVVVWIQCEDGMTEVLISEGVSRVKVVGALQAMAMDTWMA